MRTEKRILVLDFILCVCAIVTIFPLFWMISSAFKLPNELFTTDIRLIPHHPTLENFRIVVRDYGFFTWLGNSVLSTLGIAFGQVAVSLLAAFAVTYYRTKYNEAAFYFLLVTMVIPFQVTMIPNYILMSHMGLLNTLRGVILPSWAAATTFFFLRQHLRGIPRAFYDAAVVEGASSFWILTHVVANVARSAISAILILALIDGWNLYFWPLLVLSSEEKRTLTIGLTQFIDHEIGNRWGPFMATATMASVPIIALYLCIQKNIIEAFVSSGVKG